IPKFVDDNKYIPYPELLFMQEVGIMTGAFGMGGPEVKLHSLEKDKFLQTIHYYSRIAILSGSNPATKLEIPVFPLTEVGREIYAISDTKTPHYDFFEEFCKS